MKVNDFAKRLGIGSSKVRYYDRIGLIQGERCEENNYRNFSDLDALNIYHAQMLRSFDMSVQESLAAKKEGLTQISGWIGEHIDDLEALIRKEEMRLFRLREMQDYFMMIQKAQSVITEHDLDDNYNVFNFGCCSLPDEATLKTIQMLADAMPFSYIAIKVSKASIFNDQPYLDVSIGLGILERNRKKLGLNMASSIRKYKGGKALQMFVLSSDPFHLTKQDLAPFLAEIKRRGIEIKEDLVGRIYISYMENDVFMHGIGLGLPIE